MNGPDSLERHKTRRQKLCVFVPSCLREMPEAILIATTNPGKLREIRGILAGCRSSCLARAIPRSSNPKKPATTFAENARLKALYYPSRPGCRPSRTTPGSRSTRSATRRACTRRAGTARTTRRSSRRSTASWRRAGSRPARRGSSRTSRWRDRGQHPFEATGIVEGEIAPEPKGIHGFGYDPIFFYPPYGCTLAEVDGAQERPQVSHRGKAFRAAASTWLSNLP